MAVLDTLDTLAPIREKVLAGERLDFDDGVALMETDDLLALGDLADLARRQRGGGDEVYFVQNINLYQTNVCRVKCKFCAFAKTRKQEDAFTLTADEFVEDAVAQHELHGFTEIHTVNGENPHVDLEYYAGLLRKLKEALPDVHLKFYTASEIHHISRLEGCSHEEVLRTLRDAGLDSMPGGGAEIFADRVRALIAPGKEHPDEWFDVHDTAHKLGITTQCTMLYGHVETYEERVDHLLRLRDQQDETARLPLLHPARLPPREHRLRAARLPLHDRRRRPEGDRRLAAVARQRPAREGVLDHDGPPARPGRAPLRRRRRPGHGRAGEDLPGGGRERRHRAEGRRARPLRPRRGPHPGAARQPLQRDAPMVNLDEISLAPDVVWIGVLPELLCRSADLVDARLEECGTAAARTPRRCSPSATAW